MRSVQLKLLQLCRFVSLLITMPALCLAQRDPGVRQGAPGAGEPLKGLTPIELSMFNEGLNRALQLEAVCDGCSDLTLGSFTDPAKGNLVTQTNSSGLGVRFNGDQCTACHNQPVVGGSGGFIVPNPQDPPSQILSELSEFSIAPSHSFCRCTTFWRGIPRDCPLSSVPAVPCPGGEVIDSQSVTAPNTVR